MQPLVLTRLDGSDGGAARVVLSIAGYQFAAPRGGVSELAGDAERAPTWDWDANWLVLDLTLTHEGRVFSRRDPCLETRDLPRIADFLDKCARLADAFASWGRPRLRSTLSFTEPNLQLEVHSGPPLALRVHLAAECVPPFAQDLDHEPTYDEHENIVGASTVWLDFHVSQADLHHAAESVRTWAASFPARRDAPSLKGGVPPVTKGALE